MLFIYLPFPLGAKSNFIFSFECLWTPTPESHYKSDFDGIENLSTEIHCWETANPEIRECMIAIHKCLNQNRYIGDGDPLALSRGDNHIGICNQTYTLSFWQSQYILWLQKGQPKLVHLCPISISHRIVNCFFKYI